MGSQVGSLGSGALAVSKVGSLASWVRFRASQGPEWVLRVLGKDSVGS